MGFFDDAFEALENNMMKQLEGSFEELKINQKRPGIDTLPFRPVPAAVAGEIRQAKAGLFGGGTRNKLAAGIEEAGPAMRRSWCSPAAKRPGTRRRIRENGSGVTITRWQI